MGIDSVVLLRTTTSLAAGLATRALDDGVLIFTPVRFGHDEKALAPSLRAILGEALEGHEDTRGMFVLPDVAEPTARTYEGVIAECCEVGFWVAPRSPQGVPEVVPNAAPESTAGILADMHARLGPDFMAELVRAVQRGDVAAKERLEARMIEQLGGPAAVAGLGERLNAAASAEAPSLAEKMNARLAKR